MASFLLSSLVVTHPSRSVCDLCPLCPHSFAFSFPPPFFFCRCSCFVLFFKSGETFLKPQGGDSDTSSPQDPSSRKPAWNVFPLQPAELIQCLGHRRILAQMHSDRHTPAVEESGRQVGVSGLELPSQACSCLDRMSPLGEAPHSQPGSSWRAGPGSQCFLSSRREDLKDERGARAKKAAPASEENP